MNPVEPLFAAALPALTDLLTKAQAAMAADPKNLAARHTLGHFDAAVGVFFDSFNRRNGLLPGDDDEDADDKDDESSWAEETDDSAEYSVADDNVPEVAYTLRAYTDAMKNVQCGVCLAGYHAGEVMARLPCQHEFHEPCLAEWWRVRKTCPMCRDDYNSDNSESMTL